MLEARLGLNKYLTAGATRTDRLGLKLSLRVAGGNGQHNHGLVGMLSTSSKEC